MANDFEPFSLNIHGRLLQIERPQIMGIINVTPDSFYSGSRTPSPLDIQQRVRQMIADGADMIDIGAYSSRPGADDVSPDEELRRLEIGMEVLRSVAPDIPVSIDTFRASVARRAIRDLGADIINDISGGSIDPDMLETVADLHVPYILMHMRGTPADMQQHTDYTCVTTDAVAELSRTLATLEALGVPDVIIDPGFGFSKTLEQNYRMMHDLEHFRNIFHRPVLVGISRKSMITRALGITPAEALNGTTVLNTIALLKGASILRVHDVRAAREALTLTQLTANPS